VHFGGTSTAHRPTILTWGLLGPGKGIEWAIDALVELRHVVPAPRYLVVGETHPRVAEREGEAYRQALQARAGRRGVGRLVEFDARYLDARALSRVVAQADIVLLPYDSREQVTSGVLVEALAAGKPVIATGFPHAVELLGGGTGLVVPHGDSAAMAAAVRRVLTEPGLAARLGAEAAALAPQLLWPAVAERYRALAAEVIETRASAVA
jgi:glycosyltransferase involved in cell wall biosynthesis